MKRFISNRRLGDILAKKGLLPPDCRLLEASVEIDGAFTIRYERYVTADQLSAFADALKEAVEEHYADDTRNEEARKR
jgi:hypothetical protein